MKKYCIILLTLGATAACLGMNLEEKKELKKSIIINHQNKVNETTFSDKRYITFGIDEIGAEIYDIKDNKIIKTVDNLFWFPGFPLLNKYNSSVMAFERKKENITLCSLYELENEKEITFNVSSVSGSYFTNHFILLGKKLLHALQNEKGYSIYDLESNTSKIITFNEQMKRYSLSCNEHYLAIALKNNMLFLGDLAYNEAKLVSSKSNVSKFSPDSTLLACFDQEYSVITLYDTKNYRVINQQRTKDAVIEILFPNASTVWFSPDRQNYTIWDIEKDTITTIDLGERAYRHEIEILLKNFVYFNLHDFQVYNLITKKLFTLKENGKGVYLIFNNNETYAAYTTNDNLAVLYETKNWQPVTSITFENGWLNPFTTFSPCGKFLAITSIGAKWIKFYDIEKDALVFEAQLIPQRWHLEFHERGFIIFQTHDNLLIIYDYLNNRISKIDTNEKITSYKCKDDVLTVSTGSTTTLFKFENLPFTDYIKEEHDIIRCENKNSFEWMKNYKNMRFYTHEIAACQSDQNTIVLYNHTKNKKNIVKRDEKIMWFAIKNDHLIISYDEKEEYLALNKISFEQNKENEESQYCVVA